METTVHEMQKKTPSYPDMLSGETSIRDPWPWSLEWHIKDVSAALVVLVMVLLVVGGRDSGNKGGILLVVEVVVVVVVVVEVVAFCYFPLNDPYLW